TIFCTLIMIWRFVLILKTYKSYVNHKTILNPICYNILIIKDTVMNTSSRNWEIQEELSEMYNSLVSEKNKVKNELVISRFIYKTICEKHINNNYNHEQEWLQADRRHHGKYLEYD